MEPRRLGKMAARSDAARQRPPGRPGLQHKSFRPPSDATPPRYCRFSALPPYFSPKMDPIGWQSTKTAVAGRGCVRRWSKRCMLKPWASWWSLPRGVAPGSHLPQTARLQPLSPHIPLPSTYLQKNLGVGRKKIARPVRNFPIGENWI